MKKEDLSEAIREGMNKASDDFWNAFTKGLIGAIIIVVMLLLLWIQVIDPYLWNLEQKRCAEDPNCVESPNVVSMLIRTDDELYINCYTKLYEEENHFFTLVPFDNFEDALAYKQLAEEYMGQPFYEFKCDGFQDKEYLKDFEDYLKNKKSN